jgi:uncharacterized protein (TIGR03437 family)
MRTLLMAIFSALALRAAAQPLMSVAVATDAQQSSGMTVQLLTDWNAKWSFVVSGNKITAVNHADGSSDITSLPVSAQNSCISSSGLIATTLEKSSSGNILTTVQTVKFNGPGNWDIRTLNLGLSHPFFGGAGSCAFASDGTLWLASNLIESSEIPKIVSVDVNGQRILNQWKTDQKAFSGIVATATGVYLGITYPRTGEWGLGMIGSDGQYRVASLQSSNSGTENIFAAPNGYLFTGNKVFNPQGEPVSTAAPSTGAPPAIAWPGNDTWSGYVLIGGKIFIKNFYQGLAYPSGPTSIYFAIASHRQSDGTDLVFALRDGMIDSYSIAPAPMADFAANAGSYQPGPLAPGMHFTIVGQGLTAKADEADIPAGDQIAIQLGKTVVRLDGVPLRLDYASNGQINARIPSDIANGSHLLGIAIDGKHVQAAVTIVDQALAAFQWAPDQSKPTAVAPILTDGNYRLIGDPALSPAYAQPGPGDTIILWATGGGRTSPLIDDSVASPAGIYPLVITPQILVDGQQAYVAYAGRGNGFSGLDQINFIVPSGLPAGPHDFQVGGMVYRGGLWTK